MKQTTIQITSSSTIECAGANYIKGLVHVVNDANESKNCADAVRYAARLFM